MIDTVHTTVDGRHIWLAQRQISWSILLMAQHAWEAYVHGIMHGEAFEGEMAGKFEDCWFEID
jgi:hypothetical protein